MLPEPASPARGESASGLPARPARPLRLLVRLVMPVVIAIAGAAVIIAGTDADTRAVGVLLVGVAVGMVVVSLLARLSGGDGSHE
ncbi:MAG: hypothetical protein LT070_11600 [Solirubrobacteraceae bacterium]|nr:hypothetical protein [Solirubrobacteraceae bacterium]